MSYPIGLARSVSLCHTVNSVRVGEGRRLKLGDTHPHTLDSINNLIDLYEAWNKPDQAAERQAKLPSEYGKLQP